MKSDKEVKQDKYWKEFKRRCMAGEDMDAVRAELDDRYGKDIFND